MGETILTTNQQRLLLEAKRDKKITDTFYLTGGTALSNYYLHHRTSEDFDFFSEQELKHQDLIQWSQKVAKKTGASDIEFQTLSGQFIYYFHYEKEVVKVDFAYYPFEHIGEFFHDESLRVSSILDIGVNKLHAIMTRKRGRDYVDLFEIIRSEISLNELIRNYRLKFDLYISPEEWAKYFAAVIDATDQPRFLGSRNWTNIENFFLREAKQLTKGAILL